MNRFDWNKLSPDEFQRLQDYISCKQLATGRALMYIRLSRLDAPKKVKDVVATLEQDPTWLAHRNHEVSNETERNITSTVCSSSKSITKVFDSFSIFWWTILPCRKIYRDIFFSRSLKNLRTSCRTIIQPRSVHFQLEPGCCQPLVPQAVRQSPVQRQLLSPLTRAHYPHRASPFSPRNSFERRKTPKI